MVRDSSVCQKNIPITLVCRVFSGLQLSADMACPRRYKYLRGRGVFPLLFRSSINRPALFGQVSGRGMRSPQP